MPQLTASIASFFSLLISLISEDEILNLDGHTVDRISSAVLRGVSHEGILIGRVACDQEQEGNRDTRVRQVQAVSMT